MATLGERVFTFKADFRGAIAGAQAFIGTLGKLSLTIGGVVAAWIGLQKFMQTNLWKTFAERVVGSFETIRKYVDSSGLFKKIKEGFGSAFESVMGRASQAGAGATAGSTGALNAFKQRFDQIKNSMASLGQATGQGAISFWQKFSTAVSSAGHSLESLVKDLGGVEFGLIAMAGPLGKTVVGLSELSATAALAGTALAAMGAGPLASLAFKLSAFSAGISAAITATVAAVGALTEAIGNKLTGVTSRWLDVGLDFERQQYGLERSVRAFQVATGDTSVSAEDLVKKIRDISAETGISAAEIKQGVNVMFEMSRVTKLTGSQMDDLIKAMADFSTVRGVSFAETVYAVDQSFRGWHQSASALGLTLDDASVQALATQRGFDKLGQEAGQSSETTNRFRVALEQMQQLGLNASAESAEKLASGALRKLQGELNTLHGLLGLGVAQVWQPFYKLLGDIAEGIRTTLGESVLKATGAIVELGAQTLKTAGFMAKWGGVIATVSSALGILRFAVNAVNTSMGGLSALFGASASGLGQLAQKVGDLGPKFAILAQPLKALQGFFENLSKSGMGLGRILIMLARGGVTLLWQSLIALLIPLGIFLAKAAAVAAIVYVVIKAFQMVERETQVFSQMWEMLTDTGQGVITWLKELDKQLGLSAGAVQMFKDIFAGAIKLVALLITGLADVFLIAVDAMTRFQIAWAQITGDFDRAAQLEARLGKIYELQGRLAELRERLDKPPEGPGAGANTALRLREEQNMTKTLFNQTQAWSALSQAKQEEIVTTQKLFELQGKSMEARKRERDIFLAQTKELKGMTEEIFNEAVARFDAQTLQQKAQYLEKYARIIGKEKELAQDRVNAEVTLLDKSLVSEEDAARIRAALQAGEISKLQAHNAEMLAARGEAEAAFEEGLKSEINAMIAAGEKMEDVQAIATRKLQDEMNRRNAILADSARERVAAQAGQVVTAAQALTGPTMGTAAMQADIAAKNEQIELEKRLIEIRREGINVTKLTADAIATSNAKQMQIQTQALEETRQLLIQRNRAIIDANNEVIQSQEELAQTFLQVTDQAFAARLLEVRQRGQALTQERDERIAAIRASAQEAVVKEQQISSVLQSEAAKRAQLYLQEQETRKNALLEFYNLSAQLERQQREKGRRREDVREAEEDLAALERGRPISARRQRERALRQARQRVEDIRQTPFEQRAEEIQTGQLRRQRADAMNVAFGGEVAMPQVDALRQKNQNILQDQNAKVAQLNQAMEVLRVQGVAALTQSMQGLDAVIRRMTGQEPAPPFTPPAAPGTPPGEPGEPPTLPGSTMEARRRFQGGGAAIAAAPSQAIQAVMAGGGIDVDKMLEAGFTSEDVEKRMANLGVLGVASAQRGPAPSMQNAQTELTGVMTNLQQIWNDGVTAMVASFNDKTANVSKRIVEIAATGLPEELVSQRMRSKGDR